MTNFMKTTIIARVMAPQNMPPRTGAPRRQFVKLGQAPALRPLQLSLQPQQFELTSLLGDLLPDRRFLIGSHGVLRRARSLNWIERFSRRHRRTCGPWSGRVAA